LHLTGGAASGLKQLEAILISALGKSGIGAP
jgi:hypothetical protein